MARGRLASLVLLVALAACGGGEGGSPRPGAGDGAGGTGGASVADEGALHGRVLLVDGAPAVGATVTLGGQAPVVVGADGAFAFRDLAPGSYGLEVSLDPYRTERRSRLEVAGGRDLEVPPVVLQRVTAVEGDRLSSEVFRNAAGSALLFCAGRDPEREVADAWLWDDAGDARKLAAEVDASLCYRSDAGSFSPDDRFVMFPLARPYPEREEWTLVDLANGDRRSLGAVRDFQFWPDSSRLLWTGSGETGDQTLRLLALPSLEETLLCEPGGVEAMAPDLGALICAAGIDGSDDYFPDLARWDLATMTSEPVAEDAWIIGITPGLDRAFLLADDGASRTGILWRRGQEPVRFGTGVRWSSDATCDEAVEKGFLVAGGELFQVDLVAGTAVSIDRGVDAFDPAPSQEQVFYYKDLADNRGRLFSWDERSGTAAELGAGVPASSWAPLNDWPRQAVFVANSVEGDDYLGDLYLTRFDGAPPRLLGSRATPVRLDAAGLVFFHDVDATGTGSLALLAPGADTPTTVLPDVSYEDADGRHAPAPRISERMDRIVASRRNSETGAWDAVAWGPEHGVAVLGGSVRATSPSFDRVLALSFGPSGYPEAGPLRFYDFATGEARTLGDRVVDSWTWYDGGLDRIVFANRTDSGEGAVLKRFDRATGETRTLLENAVNLWIWPNLAWTHAMVGTGLGATQDVYLADLGTGRVEAVGAANLFQARPLRDADGNRLLLVDVGYDALPSSGRLLLLDLPSMTVTVLDDAAAPFAPWVNDDFSAIVYRRDVADPDPANERDTVGELWARALRPGASSYRVDGEVRGVVLGTAGSFLYEVEGEGIRAGEWPR